MTIHTLLLAQIKISLLMHLVVVWPSFTTSSFPPFTLSAPYVVCIWVRFRKYWPLYARKSNGNGCDVCVQVGETLQMA